MEKLFARPQRMLGDYIHEHTYVTTKRSSAACETGVCVSNVQRLSDTTHTTFCLLLHSKVRSGEVEAYNWL